jgi:hypothetical protein
MRTSSSRPGRNEVHLPARPEGVTPNPLYELVTSQDEEDRVRTLGSTELRWTPAGWITLDANLSYDRSDRMQRFFFPRGAKTNGRLLDRGSPAGNGGPPPSTPRLTAQLRGQWKDFSGRLTFRALQETEDYEFFSAEPGLSVGGVTDLDAGTVPVGVGLHPGDHGPGLLRHCQRGLPGQVPLRRAGAPGRQLPLRTRGAVAHLLPGLGRMADGRGGRGGTGPPSTSSSSATPSGPPAGAPTSATASRPTPSRAGAG